jgi:Flp pilus assembly protein TadG
MARPFSRRARRPRTRGQAMVEVALVLPVFLVLLMTLFDFGRVIYAQHTITQDAREGVRKGIVSTGDLNTNAKFTQRFADIRAATRLMSPAVPITDASIFGAPGACSAVQNSPIFGTPAMPNDAVTPADATVAASCFYPNGASNGSAARPAKVVVRIQVRVDFITPILSNILGGGITISAQAEQLIQS